MTAGLDDLGLDKDIIRIRIAGRLLSIHIPTLVSGTVG
jgi:hypothetical protein